MLGVRKAESAARSRSISEKEIAGYLLNPHNNINNAYVYNPLTEIENSLVWEYLLKDDGSLSKLLIVTIVDSKSILITIAPNIFWLIISIGQNALESN